MFLLLVIVMIITMHLSIVTAVVTFASVSAIIIMPVVDFAAIIVVADIY